MAEWFINQTAERMRARSEAAAKERAAEEAENAGAMKALEERIAAAKAGRDPESWAVKEDPKRAPAVGKLVSNPWAGRLPERVIIRSHLGGIEIPGPLGDDGKYWHVFDDYGRRIDLRKFCSQGDMVRVNDTWGRVVDAMQGIIEKPATIWVTDQYVYELMGRGITRARLVDLARPEMASMPLGHCIDEAAILDPATLESLRKLPKEPK